MDKAVYDIIAPMLKGHESKRQFPYDDATGKRLRQGDTIKGFITIGIGRNLDANGLRDDEIALCFSNDLNSAERTAVTVLGPSFYSLTPMRRAVLIDMAFNLGHVGLSSFSNTLRNIREGNHSQAAIGMKQSKWARQVGDRAIQLANLYERG